MINKALGFGVVGAGLQAAEFVDSFRLIDSCRLVAVYDSDASRADAFARRFRADAVHRKYADLLVDTAVDIVYVATPHILHAELSIAAMRAGKHVLCEKPLAVNARDAEVMISAARDHGVFLMEAVAYHFHPQTQRLIELIRDGAIGDVRAIDVTFSFNAEGNPGGRLFENRLAGGGILDVGCYCVSASRLIAEAALGVTTTEPHDVVGMAHLDPDERIDLYAMALLRFPHDIIAQISCGVALEQAHHIRVYGSRGHIYIPRPAWYGPIRDEASRIYVESAGGENRVLAVPGINIFSLEADRVAGMVRQGPEASHPTWEDSLANMRTLDRWREAVGVAYSFEQMS